MFRKFKSEWDICGAYHFLTQYAQNCQKFGADVDDLEAWSGG